MSSASKYLIQCGVQTQSLPGSWGNAAPADWRRATRIQLFATRSYVHTSVGFLYLAVVLDLATRLVVGWSMATHMEVSLVDEALTNAPACRDPEPGMIHHSDRGSVYTSSDYQKRLKDHSLTPSMSGKGDCWDNAVMESFFGSYKQECAHRERWSSLGEARLRTADYIESFYNQHRLHSALDLRTPVEVDMASRAMNA